MLLRTIRKALWASTLSALLSLPAPSSLPAAAAAAVAAGAFAAAVPSVAEAQSRARSSGGYSRPRASSRTPSFGATRAAPRRTPSTSGGYGRPAQSFPGYATRRPSVTSPSAADRGFSRQQSGDALGRYRAQQAPPPAPTPQREQGLPPPPATSATVPGFPGGQGPFGGRPNVGYGGPGWLGGRPNSGYRTGWFGDRGWAAPPYVYRTPRSFGIWDGLFLWFLLDNLTRPGYADFFHHHQNDPGYRQWRAEAERLARENADVRQRLETLDRQVAEKQGQPKDPEFLPPDTPPEVAAAAPDDARTPSTAEPPGSEGEGFGPSSLIVLVLAGGGVAAFLIRRRRTAAAGGNTPAGGGGTLDPLRSAGNILRHKVSGEAYTPSHFRVGMTLTLDPTPFILAGGATKAPMPDAGGGNELVSVEAVGTLESGGTRLTRLYLPGGNNFFQLHLGPDGRPDECRYFGHIDEVSPADPNEWSFWLDPAEGAIGWPEFQTKDGKVYPRAWAPGDTRVAPREFAETVETAGGRRAVRSLAMLYAAPTGSAAPAPETEYVLVAAVEVEGQAWVEVHAGIDVNPAALSLA
jgi:hypothetical protein